MPEPSVRVTLQPLLCEVCGAAVSLGQEDETRCTHCGATRSVPQDYRRLRDAGALARGDRDALDELYARMTRPPGPLASAWMAAGSWATVLAALGTLVLTVLLVVAVLVIDAWKGSGAIPGAVVAAVVEVVVAVPASFEWLLHTVCGNSFDVADALGPYTGAALGTLVYVLVGVPGSVGWFFEESTEGVAALRREMAATPPPGATRRAGDVPRVRRRPRRPRRRSRQPLPLLPDGQPHFHCGGRGGRRHEVFPDAAPAGE